MVDWARTSGITWLYTGNDARNTRMLAINARMGYDPLPSVCACVKALHHHEETALPMAEPTSGTPGQDEPGVRASSLSREPTK